MADKYIITVDQRHFRIFREESAPGQMTPTLTPAEVVDLVDGHGNYFDRDTDKAGRFPSSKGRPLTTGGSIDERLPMQEEYQRRIAEQIAQRLNAFLQARPEAKWNYAAGPQLYHTVLEKLNPGVKTRLEHAVQKELANVPVAELRGHFPATRRIV